MTAENSDKPSNEARAQLTAFAQEHRGNLMLEALAAACAIISHADGRSSLIERWRLSTVLADDPLLAAMPPGALAEESEMHLRAFIVDPTAARAAALLQVARLAPEPHKARMVLDACILVTRADRQVHPAEMQALHDIKAALNI
jgi:tellurite resistance protein